MDQLRKQIESHTLGSLYLFYGEETYLLETYRTRLLRSLMSEEDRMMNCDELVRPSGADSIINSAETLPFMVERRLVFVRDSRAFEADGAGAFSALADFFQAVPPQTVLVFIEEHVDKRSRLYKALLKYGRAVEFTTMSEQDLARWVVIEAKRRRLRMDGMTAAYFIRLAGTDMYLLSREMEKVFAYKEGAGVVTQEDIDRIVTPSLETNVFHMTDRVGSRQAKEAYRIYRNLLRTGENAYMIFALLRRQFDILYKTAVYSEKRMSDAEIAPLMKLQPFAVRKNRAQAQKFEAAKLRDAMDELLRYDVSIKSGTIRPEQAIELMIAKYASR